MKSHNNPQATQTHQKLTHVRDYACRRLGSAVADSSVCRRYHFRDVFWRVQRAAAMRILCGGQTMTETIYTLIIMNVLVLLQ